MPLPRHGIGFQTFRSPTAPVTAPAPEQPPAGSRCGPAADPAGADCCAGAEVSLRSAGRRKTAAQFGQPHQTAATYLERRQFAPCDGPHILEAVQRCCLAHGRQPFLLSIGIKPLFLRLRDAQEDFQTRQVLHSLEVLNLRRLRQVHELKPGQARQRSEVRDEACSTDRGSEARSTPSAARGPRPAFPAVPRL